MKFTQLAQASGKHPLAVTQKAQEAWINAMCSKMARTDLLQMELHEHATFEERHRRKKHMAMNTIMATHVR